jgi:hypothetical protein
MSAWLLTSSTLTLTESGTSKASTPESILPMTMMPGSGIFWPKRTQVRLKSLLYLFWLRQIHAEPTGDLRCKSAVYGLNGHRPYYIISLFKVTYKSTIQVSRDFHALFAKTLEKSDTYD